MVVIRPVRLDERLAAARVAASALADDPILQAAFAHSEPTGRAIGIRAAFHSGLARADPPPLGAYVDGRLAGVWVAARVDGSTAGSSRVARLLADLHEREPGVPRWRVGPVGVAPGHQGRGIGAALMCAFAQRMDAEAAEAWLETGTEDALRFYRRGGYEVVARTDDDGPPGWFMRRFPR